MIGIVKEEVGIIFEGNQSKIIKKTISSGGSIPKHNHPGKKIVFIVAQGKIDITLDDDEVHHLTAGTTLTFDGSHYIQGLAKEEATIFINLVKN